MLLVRSFMLTLLCVGLSAISLPAYTQSSGFGFRPASTTGAFLAGRAALNALDTDIAAGLLMEATRENWENPAITDRAFGALAANGEIEEANAVARRLLEISPNHQLARLVSGTVALKERRFSSASKSFGGIGLENFVGITGAVLMAWTDVGQNDLSTAMARLDDLSSVGLEEFLIFHRALMADSAGDSSALEYMAQAYQTDPFVANIVEAYVRMLGNDGQFGAASDILKTYTNQGLSQPSVLALIDPISNKRLPGKYATNISKSAGEVYRAIGSALARDGAPDIALVFLQLALYLDDEADVVRLTIAELYESLDQFEEANAVYESISTKSIYRPEAIVQLAENLDALGDREGAINRLKNMVEDEPENSAAISSLADLLRFDEQYESSVEYYSQLIALEGGERPSDWIYFYLRGIAYERLQEWPNAESDFLRALELNPNQPQTLNYLGYSWVDRGENLDRALGMIETAVRANPGDGYIVDSLGWVLYKLGRVEEAVLVLEQAARLQPSDPEINDHLGDAYWRVGRQREAFFQWGMAIELDEIGDVTERAQPKLASGLPDENPDAVEQVSTSS